MQFVRVKSSSCVAAALSLGLITPVFADEPTPSGAAQGDALTEIIVTARRVEERLQDVPISISVFNQQLSIRLNTLQHDSTLEELAVLKRLEQLSAVTFRTSLEGRSTRSGWRESQGVKRSVRVQAFTCSS